MTKNNITPEIVDVYASRRKWRNPSGTKTYFAWRAMRSRCFNKKNPSWPHYGGRGIDVCEHWAKDYDAFFDDMGEAPENTSLERIDVNKGYYPENCTWATLGEQAVNKRTTRWITHNGETMCLSQWASKLGLPVDTLWRRLNIYKMPVGKALTSESLVPKWRHGTRQGYNRGCKCVDCKAAHAAHHREQRAKRKAKKSLASELGDN